MSDVLVTGATGRLGTALVQSLVGAGYSVTALSNEPAKNTRGAAQIVADINDKDSLEKAFSSSGAGTVIHLAAIVSQYRYGKSMIHKVNVEGTSNIVSLCKAFNIKHLIFASTVDIYGRSRKDTLDENSAIMPSDAYARSKAEAEKIITSSGINYTIFRMAAIYGPGFEGSFFKVFDSIVKGKAYIIGNGNNKLSLLNASDAVSAYMLAISNGKSLNKLYNLSDGNEYTQNFLYDTASKLLGVQAKPKHINKLLAYMIAKARGFDTDELRFITSNRSISISKIKSELGFMPAVSIDEGGLELVKLFLSNAQKQNIQS
ncbi:MAG: NAD(P)-dependent oxidoreductase [Candidatus Micrarchaeaceae archaeon]